jgi:hypothetical protein
MITLTELERGIFSATIADKPAVVAFVRRTRKSADDLGNSVTFNAEKIRRARALAAEYKATPYVAVEVWHKDEFHVGFAMPAELWSQYKGGVSEFLVNDKAAEKYKADAAVVKFRAHVSEKKAAPAPEPAKAPEPKPAPVVVNMKTPGWTEAELAEIQRLQETRGITRKSAIQMMRRAAKKAVRA